MVTPVFFNAEDFEKKGTGCIKYPEKQKCMRLIDTDESYQQLFREAFPVRITYRQGANDVMATLLGEIAVAPNAMRRLINATAECFGISMPVKLKKVAVQNKPTFSVKKELDEKADAQLPRFDSLSPLSPNANKNYRGWVDLHNSPNPEHWEKYVEYRCLTTFEDTDGNRHEYIFCVRGVNISFELHKYMAKIVVNN